MTPLKILVVFVLAMVIRDLIKLFILDKIKEFEQLRGIIAASISTHKEFIFPSSPEDFHTQNMGHSQNELIKIAGQIERFSTIRGPFLFLIPKSEDLQDAAYCFTSIAKQKGQNGILMKKIEKVFRLGPYQINPHNTTNHKNTQMNIKKNRKE